ncbi:hypothetical protein [Streptomyces pinistramenti]|uniref:hypothetical protein n=1 Tax=Streptomyces pinistramenti TaxID=2884812 RepID=UPI001D06CD51|nr:hypothetical protein [Streptomyces pinistramenti]MCB5908616.1 hypothetical protein [Streptomyces pinistramenti]
MSYWDTDRQRWVRGTPPGAAPERPDGPKEADPAGPDEPASEGAKWSHATLLTTVVAAVLAVAVLGFGGWSLLHHDDNPGGPSGALPSGGSFTFDPGAVPSQEETATPGDTSGGLGDPCSATNTTLSTQWQLGTGTPETGRNLKACHWQSSYGSFTLMYSSGTVSIGGSPTPIPVTGVPSAQAVPIPSGNGCLIKWPTSFGQITLGAYQANRARDMCRLAAALGSALAPSLPR